MTTQKIGRYEVRDKLGQGGMASVYIAHDPMFERDVAIKLMPEQFINDEEFAKRFRREAKTIATLEHSAIVPVYDYGEQNGQPFLVMRYMPGGSLDDRLRKGEIPFAETIKIFRRIGEALDHAHKRGIVHRDLKPANILFDQYGDAYLADFGIVQVSSEDGPKLTQTGRVIGTPTYMSPEQVYGDQKLDGRSDIYALGVILFQMLTGTPPYLANTPAKAMMKHVLEPVPEVNQYNPNLPNQFNGVVQKAMAKDRESRFSTASDLTNALDTAMKSNSPVKREPTIPPPPPPPINTPPKASTPPAGNMPPTIAFEEPMPPSSRGGYGITDQVDALKQSAAEVDAASGGLGSNYPEVKPQRGGIPTWIFVLVGVVGLACIGSAIVLGVVASRASGDAASADATETAVFAGYAESTEIARAATADAKDDFSVEETREAIVRATDEAFTASVDATATAFFLASAEETKTAALVTEEANTVPTTAPAATVTPVPPSNDDRSLIFGPTDGTIPHEADDDFVESIFTDLNVRDFMLQAVVGNPFDGTSALWDVGFLLRQTGGNDELRLVIESNGTWSLINRDGPDTLEIHEGKLTTLRAGANDSNEVIIIASNERGYFFFNGEFIQALDLSSRLDLGDVAMSTGFFAESEQAGSATPYKQLTVHSLDPLFGPRTGELAHVLDDTVKARSADVDLYNFIAEATFINPYDPSVFDYDWGFDFRKPDSGEQYWLIVNSNQGWDLVNRVGGDDNFLEEGTLPTMETGLNGRNLITLIAIDQQGFFLHNNELVATLNLRDRQTPGDVELVTAFYLDSEVEGEATGYENFTVWGLPD